MSAFPVVSLVVAALFSLMAFRAFRSGSALDYVLGAVQCIGVLLLFTVYHEFASYLLLLTAFAYLLSQVLTGARRISRLLPVVGAATILLDLITAMEFSA
jgi:thiosulfate reductase cytochrome b subunit